MPEDTDEPKSPDTEDDDPLFDAQGMPSYVRRFTVIEFKADEHAEWMAKFDKRFPGQRVRARVDGEQHVQDCSDRTERPIPPIGDDNSPESEEAENIPTGAASYAKAAPSLEPVGDEPSLSAKRRHLERILASPMFSRTARHSALLRFIVESAFDHIRIDEYTIGVKVFGLRENWYPEDNSVVRQTLSALRRRLERYARSDGSGDRLLLEIPEGHEPVFSFNPRSRVEQYYRTALNHVGTDQKKAKALLSTVLGREPNHAGALAARAEICIWELLNGGEPNCGTCPDLLVDPEEYAQKSLAIDRDNWRALIVMGAVHACRKEWQQADAAFVLAHQSSQDEAAAHPWYSAFLMATGRKDEALKLVTARADEKATDPWAQLTSTLFLYVNRQFQKARATLRGRREGDPWLHEVLFDCICTARRVFRSDPSVIDVGPSSRAGFYPAISMLCKANEEAPEARRYGFDSQLHESIKEALLACEDGSVRGPGCTQCQLAIGYMAIGDNARALALLREDFDRNHPLLMWLHLWPVFDPLRKEPEFEQLIMRMNLPPEHVLL